VLNLDISSNGGKRFSNDLTIADGRKGNEIIASQAIEKMPKARPVRLRFRI
jgi:hypothetical protein